MSEDTAKEMRETVDAVYRSESRRVFATLVRLLGDFNIAEVRQMGVDSSFAGVVMQTLNP